MQALKEMEPHLREAPDGQFSLTDPDARSMAISGKGTGVVGYNVQTAVDTRNQLIVAHEVTNVGHDRAALATMAEQAREVTGSERLSVGTEATSAGWKSWRASRRALVVTSGTSDNKVLAS